MKVLFLGGTGNISSACTRAAIEKGIDLFHFNRGNHTDMAPAGVETIIGDIHKRDEMTNLLKGRSFDVVVNWNAYNEKDVEEDIKMFSEIVGQYIFISTASAYQKPPGHYVITEETALENPFWEYSRKKIACEHRLMRAWRNDGFPVTIVRPSHTYGHGWFPTAFGSGEFTVPQRILDGKPVIVHGDGQSIWTLTWAEDFAQGFTGLLGAEDAIGDAFHVPSYLVYSWDNIHHILADVLGKKAEIIHIPSDYIARIIPERGETLLGDKSYSAVFDNTKIKRINPSFEAVVPLEEGLKRSLVWLKKHPEKIRINQKTNSDIERILTSWKS